MCDSSPSGGKWRVLITRKEFPPKALKLFEDDKYELVIAQSYKRDVILHDIQGVDAAVWFGHMRLDKEMITAAGDRLKVVASMGAGYDHISVEELTKRNILVSNTPDILSAPVADMAVGLALAVSRNILLGHNSICNDEWVVNHPTWMCGIGLEGATVGIVGFGAIGRKIAQRIKTFDIGKLLYYNPSEKPEAKELGATKVELEELLRESDFVFLSCPLTEQTKHLINKKTLEWMKDTSILINIARGDVVNQDDLVVALKEKKIWGAGLDVMTPEPLPPTHELTKLPNVVLTPHISSATFSKREEMAALAVQNVLNALNKQPLKTAIPGTRKIIA